MAAETSVSACDLCVVSCVSGEVKKLIAPKHCQYHKASVATICQHSLWLLTLRTEDCGCSWLDNQHCKISVLHRYSGRSSCERLLLTMTTIKMVVVAVVACCHAIPVSIRLLPSANHGSVGSPRSGTGSAPSQPDDDPQPVVLNHHPVKLKANPSFNKDALPQIATQHRNQQQPSHTPAKELDQALSAAFQIPQPSSPVAAFFLAPHKTASVFVNELLHSITMATDRCWYRIAQQSRSGVCADYSR